MTYEVFETFMSALGLMGKAMTGIFLFMLIFYLIIKILNKIYKNEKEITDV
jgi:hypothetical protein